MKIEVELTGPPACGKTKIVRRLYSAIQHCIQTEFGDLPKQEFEIVIYDGEDESRFKPVSNK